VTEVDPSVPESKKFKGMIIETVFNNKNQSFFEK
jgi:hypothetical protein